MKNDFSAARMGLDEVRDYWERRASSNPDDLCKIESGMRGQRMRFENFLQNHPLEGAKILDLGCGVGDFYAHLRKKNISCDYLGVDLAEAMVERAKERFPDGRFAVGNVLDWTDAPRFDYTVAFAIHNVRMEGGAELLRDVTKRQFELCDRGAHLSLLTDRFTGFDSHIQPWRAEEVLSMALEITPYVVLRHDYLPNDFSVTLYREPVIDRRCDLLADLQ
jgi:SAM-dependent methyltransferase